MKQSTCKQCGQTFRSKVKLMNHYRLEHPKETKTAMEHTHDHDHDESVPHTHDFGERVEYLKEGAKSLLKEMEVKKLALEGELSALEQHISFLRKNLTFGVAD